MNATPSWCERLAARLRAAGRYWDIPDRRDTSQTYLERYYLLPGRRGPDGVRHHEDRLVPFFNVFLHRFRRSDDDSYHDHPWHWWISIVLSTGYWEETPHGRVWRRPWSFAFRAGRSRHRVILDPAKPRPWTLFVAGSKSITWGFMLPQGWVPYWIHLFRPDLVGKWFHKRRAACP